MPTDEYTITPLVLAMGLQREKSRFTYLNYYGERIDIPYIAWLIQGAGLNVLVDSGCSAEQYRKQIKPAQGALHIGGEEFKDVVDVELLEVALEKRGLAIEDIQVFVQTHLDWDHSMSTPKFKNSRVVIQKTELDDQPTHPLYRYANVPEATMAEIRKLHLDVIDGDATIAPGLDILYTPGHTAGGQSLRVNTRRGVYVIGGLCTVLDNYYVSEELARQIGYDIIPPGTHLDARVAYASCRRIRDAGGANVLPLHEPSFVGLGTLPPPGDEA
jgi:N-acyl homoserine lactone hydrolase